MNNVYLPRASAPKAFYQTSSPLVSDSKSVASNKMGKMKLVREVVDEPLGGDAEGSRVGEGVTTI